MFLQHRDVQSFKSLNHQDFFFFFYVFLCYVQVWLAYFACLLFFWGGSGEWCLSIRMMCDYKLAVFDSCAKTVRTSWWGDCVCVGVMPKPHLLHQLLSISYTCICFLYIYILKKFPVQLVTRKKIASVLEAQNEKGHFMQCFFSKTQEIGEQTSLLLLSKCSDVLRLQALSRIKAGHFVLPSRAQGPEVTSNEPLC